MKYDKLEALAKQSVEGAGADSVPEMLEAEEDVVEGSMVCEQLDLPGAVEEDVVV